VWLSHPGAERDAGRRANTDLLQHLPGTAPGLWQIAYDPLLAWPVLLILLTVFTHGRKDDLRDMLLALVVCRVFTSRAGR
jgi:hypothetical protein